VGFEQLLQQVADARDRAAAAAQAARDDRRRRREENDQWVTGGVNWNGFGLESLIKMVADRSSVAQLEALAGEWSRHGTAVSQASDDLQRSLGKLMQFWTGQAADQAVNTVMTNARWIGELGVTAQQMSGPIKDASGALRSAQDTMPGMPKNNWLATAGGGAAAGFAVGGPVGAAFGAAIGGIASAFGFGNSKKKMKRKAVQTMQRYENALLGVDQGTPQFGGPSDGVNPGDPRGSRPDPGIGQPGIPAPPPGGGVVRPTPPPMDGNHVTDPSFAGGGPEGRWQSITGLGPGVSGAPGLGTGGGGGGGGGVGPGTGAFPGVPGLGGGRGPGGPVGGPAGRGGTGRGGTGRGGTGRGGTGVTGRGGAGGTGRGGTGATGRGGTGSGVGGRGANGRGGTGGRGAGGKGAGGRGGGYPGTEGGAGGRDREYRGRGRFSKNGAYGPGGGGAGRREEDEEDGEHRRTVPLEEDLFSSDLKAAPPVIGL
jgi:hypothetical protein